MVIVTVAAHLDEGPCTDLISAVGPGQMRSAGPVSCRHRRPDREVTPRRNSCEDTRSSVSAQLRGELAPPIVIFTPSLDRLEEAADTESPQARGCSWCTSFRQSKLFEGTYARCAFRDRQSVTTSSPQRCTHCCRRATQSTAIMLRYIGPQ
jgi:hypothetical protein